MQKNLQFHFDNCISQLFIVKSLFTSINYLPRIKKIDLSFLVRRLENIDDTRTFNYFYLFKFFFGQICKINNYKTAFILGKHYISFDVNLFLYKSLAFYSLYIWVYELQPVLNLAMARDYFFTKSKISVVLWDITIFTEKKTNVGLFDLKDPLHINIYVIWGNEKFSRLINTKLLLNYIKFKLN